MGGCDEGTCPPAGEGLGPAVALRSFGGDREGVPGVGPLSRSADQPLLAVSGLGSVPGKAERAELEAASLFLRPTPALVLISALAASHFGSLPSPTPPPYITPSWPQPDSSPNSGLGLARSRLVLFVIGLAGLAGLAQPCPALPQPCFRCLKTTPVWNTSPWWAWGGARKAALSTSPPPPGGPGHQDDCSLPLPHSVAGYPEPQHPGYGAQCCALPACEPRVLSHTESGEGAGWGAWGGLLPSMGRQLCERCPSSTAAVWPALLPRPRPPPGLCWRWDVGLGKRLGFLRTC